MTAPHTTTGSQRRSCSWLGKLGHRPLDEGKNVLAELGVDEALDLLALRRVPPAAGIARELRTGQQVEELEHPRKGTRIASGQLLVERQAHGEICQAVLQVLGQFH